jgi:hypothetical protein
MFKYTKENVVINDRYIELNNPWEIIAPVVQNVSIYDGLEKYLSDLTKFSKEQKYVFAITWYQSEVENGGHDQFFFNSTGIVYQDVLEGLNEIGAVDYYSIAKEAGVRMGVGLGQDLGTRRDFLETTKPDFDDLDTRFYALDKKNPLEKILKEYILDNKAEFYFKGVIEVSDFDPEIFVKDFWNNRKK